MRTLIGSLLLVVLTAIVGVGWTLDQLFDRIANEDVNDEVQIYQEMGAQLAAILNSRDDARNTLLNDINTDIWGISLQQSKNFQLPPTMLAKFHTGEALVLESDEGVTLHFYLPDNEEVLSITPTNYNAGSRSAVRLMFTTLFYIFVLICLLLWLYPLIRRLTKLSAAARDFGRGHLDKRVSTQGVSYIADIEAEFNSMAERIQTLVSDNKLLSSAVSHDLRTPLARLRFGIDTLEDTNDATAREKYIQRLSADISEMEKLVGSLLDFAKLDHELPEKVVDILPIEALTTQCVERFSHENIPIALSIQGQHSIRGNANQYTMLLGNLLQNALKHAKISVNVELQRTSEGTLLTVSDDGTGIPPSQYRNVLMPFTRGGNSSADEGHGLGLAIVNRIVQRHGGSVTIGVCPELHGARISILYPY